MDGDVLVTDTRFYQVRKNAPISVSVTVGFSQAGGTAMTLNGTPIPVNQNGPTPIGAGDLTGSVLQCVTNVKDQNVATNKTSVTYTLDGGVQRVEYPYSVEVKKDSGVAKYFITFVLAA